MAENASVSEALELYSRGLISRSYLERELFDWEERSKRQRPSRFWRPGTVELEQDGSGTWRPRAQAS